MKKIEQNILDILKQGRLEGLNYFLPQIQLERKDYVAVNEVLENAGGKWDRKSKSHIFQSDPSEKLGLALETRTTINKKKEFQFFETPKELVRRMVELSEIIYINHFTYMDVLEPSAGHGAIADEIDGSRCMFRCTELDPEKVQILRDKGYAVFCGDFLTQKDEEFDRIIMNPPFTKNQDIDHVTHAYGMLRKKGRVVSVMSPHFTFAQDKKSKTFRELVEKNGRWEKIAEGTFKESGTNANTILVILDK